MKKINKIIMVSVSPLTGLKDKMEVSEKIGN